jgi:hypothetical protein
MTLFAAAAALITIKELRCPSDGHRNNNHRVIGRKWEREREREREREIKPKHRFCYLKNAEDLYA